MNQLCYRIIFNKARGMLMAVAETVRNCTGSSSRDTDGGHSLALPMARLSCIGLAVLTLVGATMTLLPRAQAQIVADPNAPRNQQPVVVNTANGVPQVNIQTPSAAGVSRNTYSQFDVQRNGAVLNNSRSDVQTQLGGWIQRNPNLANGTARVILNEVNSSNPSYLRGFVEVAGNRAQVIIANPSGVTCDGCGFINSARTTLTTGEVIMNGGNLDGYVVRGGRVRIEGAGLNDAQSDYTEIIARATEVNAGIWAKELHVTVGANRVNADHTQVTPIAAQDAAPAFGVDVAQLGGMYANKIFLVGTESGVGMRNAGNIGATIGEVSLTADGRIENSGTLNAQDKIRIQSAGVAAGSAHGVVNTGSITAATSGVTLSTDGRIDNGGSVTAQTSIRATGQEVHNSGTLSAAGSAVDVVANGTVDNSGAILAQTDVHLTSVDVKNTGSIAAANGGVTVAASGAVDNSGSMTAQSNVNITAQLQNPNGSPALRNDGTLSAVNGSIAVNTNGGIDNAGSMVARNDVRLDLSGAAGTPANMSNRGSISAIQGQVKINADGSIDNAGSMIGQAAVDIAARHVGAAAGQAGLRNGGTISVAGGAISLAITGAIDNGGKILARDGVDMRVASGSGSNGINGRYGLRNTGDIGASAGTIQLNVDGGVSNTGAVMGKNGVIIAARNASGQQFAGGQFDIDNSGSIQATDGQAQLGADGRVTNSGTITATQAVDVDAANLARGTFAGSDVAVTNNGTITATAGASTLNANSGIRNSGTIAAQSDVNLTARNAGASLYNDGKIQASNGTASLIADGQLNNAGTGIVTAKTLNMSAQEVVNDGSIGAQANASLASRSGFRQSSAAAFAANGNMVLNLAGNYSNAGQLRAGTLSLSAAQISNLNTAAIQADTITINGSGTLTNAGEISSRDLLDITAPTVDNTGVILGGDLVVRAQTLNNTGNNALLGGGNSMSLWVTSALSNRNNAVIYSAGSMVISANDQRDANGLINGTAQINNEDSIIEAGGNMELAAVNLRNTRSGVAVSTVQTLDETYALRAPSWWHNGGNQMYYKPDSSNFTSYEILYVNPADVLENRQIITPDGYVVGRVVIRTHADDSVFYKGLSWNWATFGKVSRATATEGTRVVYYTSQSNNISNPDKVAGGDDPRDGSNGVNWEPMPGYSNQYGSCTTNCIRFVTEQDYSDPNSIFRRDTQRVLAPQHDSLELTRNAHHTATEDRLASGAGAVAEIRAGGNARINIGQSLSNEFSNIVVNGSLWLGGANANITNLGQTLYRRHSFDGTFTTTGGTVTGYSMPDISEVIGTTQGAIVGNGGVTIIANNFSNADLSAGSAANIRNDITPATGSGQSIGGMLGSVATRAGSNAPNGGALPSGAGLPTMSGFPAGALFPQNGNVPVPIRPGVLFRPSASGSYLLETRSQFTDHRTWLSSDYLLTALNVDPSTVQKRLGDGYYEQRLVREQIAQLTGKVSGAASDDSQYQKLLNNGVSTAQAWGLRPGVELTPDQVSHLTSDIVWLVSQTVTLPDGTTQDVLVPRVYLAHIDDSALQSTGALVSGSNVTIQAANITNKGGMIDGRADGTGRTVLVASNDLANLGGGIRGDDIVISAGGNIRNETLTVQQTYANGQSSGSFTSLSNTAGIVAGKDLTIAAGGNVQNIGANLSSGAAGNKGVGNLSISAGGDLILDTVKTGSTLDVNHAGYNVHQTSTNNSGSSISAGGDLSLVAKRDIVLTGANVTIGSNGEGNGLMMAGREVNIGVAKNESSESYVHTTSNSNFRAQRETISAQGSSISAADGLKISAGNLEKADVKVIGSNVTAGKALDVAASGSIEVTAAQESSNYDEYSKTTSKSFLSTRTNTDIISDYRSSAVSSTLSGDTTVLSAGRDISIIGSNVVSTNGTTLSATNNITIGVATNTLDHAEQHNKQTSGLFSGGSLGITIGKRELDTKDHRINKSAVSSNVGSTDGNVTIVAGNAYSQTGSNVLTPNGDIEILAKKVSILSAQDSEQNVQDVMFKQSGLTLQITSPVLSAVQGIQQLSQAASRTSDGRMKALAGAAAALEAKSAVGAIQAGQADKIATGKTLPNGDPEMRDGTDADKAGGINLAISIGGSKSESHMEQNTSSARSSSVAAGGNVSISALGGGAESDLVVQGSTIAAGRDALLKADNEVRLLAAQSTSSQHGNNQSISGSIGISIGTDGLLFNAGLSGSKGRGDGQDVINVNTRVDAGNHLTIVSGTDTTLRGATAAGKQVTMDVGTSGAGNLNIESLQDTSTYKARQQSLGASISVGMGKMSGSFNYGRSSVDGNYASVIEQSGISAGDGGFLINVSGNTDLKGAKIASTDKAAAESKNSLTTQTLTQSDIQNQSDYSAESQSVGIGAGYGGSKMSMNGTGVGFGSSSGSESSTTKSGISQANIEIRDAVTQQEKAGKTIEQTLASINKDVSSESDTSGALTKNWNGQDLMADVTAQAQITQSFGRQASKLIGDYATEQMKIATDLIKQANDPSLSDEQKRGLEAKAQEIKNQWGDQGTLRLLAHTVVGGLTGGLAGATGSAAGTLTAPLVADALKEAGIEGSIAKSLTALASTLAGAAFGGTAGGAAALNEVANNYLKHDEAKRLGELREKQMFSQCDSSCESEIKSLEALDKKRDVEFQACVGQTSKKCSGVVTEVRQAAADYIRARSTAPTVSAAFPLAEEKTLSLARQTMDGYTVWNIGAGAVESVWDTVKSIGSAGAVGFKAILQDPKAQAELKQALGAALDFVSNPDNWPQLMGAMSPAQREQLATAYEKGDGVTVAKITSETLLNIPAGGGAGTIKNLGRTLEELANIEKTAKRLGVERMVEVPAGTKGNWDPLINTGTTGQLAPKTAYILDNGHTYVTDASGRVAKVEGSLNLNPMDRNGYQQLCSGKSGCIGDDGGHLIASSLGGAGDRINLVPQASTLNRGDWKNMEKYLRDELQSGKNVSVSIDVGYSSVSGARPSAFLVEAKIDGVIKRFPFTQ